MMHSIKAHNLEKSFGAVKAVQNYSVEIKQGDVVALVGDNGAGKSTVVKMLSGLYKPDAGEILVNDQLVTLRSAIDARKAGIETVLQDLALVPQRPVYLNLFLGREATKSSIQLLDHKLMCREAEKLFLELGVNIPSVKLPIGSLSGGQRQAVAIARAARWSQSLVIMDEPTAALGIAETVKVEELIRNLSLRGTAIFLVSHNLDQVFRLSSRISILRRGEHVGEFETAQVSKNDIVSKITGSLN
jgi:simple sugar transport system ATP-binding protein